jgi:hypothetical protein
MPSGFFLGGLTSGYQKQEALNNQADYQQGMLKLEQQHQQNQQQNIQRAEFMKLRSDAVAHLDETANQLKIAHPDWGPMQLASNPAIVSLKDMIGGFDKNLGLPPTIDSIVASLAERPSQAVTEGALARAKEGPQKRELVQSEIDKNRAVAGLPTQSQGQDPMLQNPDGPAPGEGLGDHESAIRQKYDAKTIFRAEQVLGGNMSAVTGLGYRGSASQERKKIMDAAAELAIARNIPADQVNAETARFMGQKRAASAAGLRVGNVTVAMDAAQAASVRVLETSAKVDRTSYPSLNAAILAVRKGTGDPNVVQFGIAVNTLVNNYARAVGGGNAQLTDSARREAWDNLNTAWSKGQINAAVEQINKEIASELSGAQKAMKDVTGGQSSAAAPSKPTSGGEWKIEKIQ